MKKPRPRPTVDTGAPGAITEELFNFSDADGGTSWRNPQVRFLREHPGDWLMIRPDRPSDNEGRRYFDEEARRRGNAARLAWFEYLAAKGFSKTLNKWRGILEAGNSIMVVCDDPRMFDMAYVPRTPPVLSGDFLDK